MNAEDAVGDAIAIAFNIHQFPPGKKSFSLRLIRATASDEFQLSDHEADLIKRHLDADDVRWLDNWLRRKLIRSV